MTIDADVARKLGFKDGMRVLVINAPVGYREALAAGAPGIAVEAQGETTSGPRDAVQLFCVSRAELDAHAAAALLAFRPNGLLWVCYPKGSSGVESDLNRDVDWGPIAAAGFRPVRQVAIDEVWSALRFRPISEVGR